VRERGKRNGEEQWEEVEEKRKWKEGGREEGARGYREVKGGKGDRERRRCFFYLFFLTSKPLPPASNITRLNIIATTLGLNTICPLPSYT